jgi:acylphosphatase
MSHKVRAHVVVTGRVQGVFFRVETKHAADGFGITGWVRNKRDGSVEAVFEGEDADVKAALAWCREGPPHARVSHVDVIWQDYTGEFGQFQVTY